MNAIPNFMLGASLLLGLCSAAPAAAILFDFGRTGLSGGFANGANVNGFATPIGGTGSYWWNSVGDSQDANSTQEQNTSYTNFKDETGTSATGITLTVTSSTMLANGYLNGGLASNATSPAHGYDPSAALVGKFAVAAVTGDYWFTTSNDSFKISGLNPANTYDFKFFGSRIFDGAQRTTTYSATGAGGPVSSTSLATTGTNIGADGILDGNNNTFRTLTGITPNASGEITITIAATSGGFGYLNAMEMSVVPEPGATLLGGLGILVLLRRRRSN